MRRLAVLLLALAAGWVVPVGADTTPATAAGREVLLLRVDGAIGPATAGYVERGLRQAAERQDALVVLELDTPGGLDISMRDIIKAILASPVPVATYVAPSGSRAASAGTYILYASHVAAMAPATTLGAATPIAIGLGSPGGGPEPGSAAASAGAPAAVPPPHDTLERKRISDAAAYMRSLALLRGRNAEWGERAVREAVSLPSNEALAQHVVDALASDVPDLLRQVDGRVVRLDGGVNATLAVAGARVVPYEPDWRDHLLAVISDPNLALLLMLAGFYGLLFEFSNPGLIAPGVIGGVCLLLGLYGLQTLPISAAGIALLALGLGFFAAEAFVPSHGALGLGGLVAFGVGAVMLLDSRRPGFGVSPALVLAMALSILGLVVLLGSQSLRARRRPPASGSATLLGAVGEVVEATGQQGWIEVHGERWQVRSASALRAGERVCVRRVDGLVLEVEGTA